MNDRRDIRVDAVYDIETANWTQFVVGGIAWPDGTYQAIDWRREDELVDAILAIRTPDEKRARVWAHNGGKFDHKWLADHLLRRGVKFQLIAAGSRIIRLTAPGIEFLDSAALTKMRLSDLTQGLTDAKTETNLPCVCEPGCTGRDCRALGPACPLCAGKGCGGYCSISRNMPRELWMRLLAYLESDCRALLAGLQRLRAFALENDLDLSATVGGAAWANASRTLGLPKQSLNATDWKFAQQGYFGGRVFVGKTESAACYELDVNSMYPSRLASFPVPTGPARRVQGRDAGAAWDGELPGIYEVVIEVPEMHIPPLPVRAKDRIAYPWGRIFGVWTRPEIEHAVEVGGQLVEVRRALVYDRQEILFKAWVEKLFSLRVAAGKKTAMGTWLKFLLNSLTGKFASRPDKERLVVNPDEIRACPCDGNCESGNQCDPATRSERGGCAGGSCRSGCSRRCGSMRPLGNPRDALVYGNLVWSLDACAHVEWAAYLTAEARVEWHRQATAVDGGTDVVYGDTDSIFPERMRSRAVTWGDDLGKWHIEAEAPEPMMIVAPKIYLRGEGARLKVKAKGITLPRDLELAARMVVPSELSGKTLPVKTSRKIVGTWSGGAHNHFFRVDESSRTLSRGTGDRILLADGIHTRPPHIDEVKL